MKNDLLRIACGCAALVLLAGYLIVFRPLENTIAALYADLESVRLTTARDAAAARAIPALSARRDKLIARLAAYRMRDSRAVTVERFLRAAARIASQDGVSIQSVTADVAQPVRPAAAQTADTIALDDLRLDVTMRGPYDTVLHAVRRLNASDLATQISVANLGNAERRSGSRPQLSATFHVVLLREPDASALQTRHV